MNDEIIYGVELTPMFPCCWYGGPYWNGKRMDNSWVYYFRTEQEARDNCAKLESREETP